MGGEFASLGSWSENGVGCRLGGESSEGWAGDEVRVRVSVTGKDFIGGECKSRRWREQASKVKGGDGG